MANDPMKGNVALGRYRGRLCHQTKPKWGTDHLDESTHT